MSMNTFGHMFRVTTWGESHGPALGATVDGCPPGLVLSEADIQPFMDARKPGQNKYTTQRREADIVRILSGVYEGRTTAARIIPRLHRNSAPAMPITPISPNMASATRAAAGVRRRAKPRRGWRLGLWRGRLWPRCCRG